MSEQEKTSREIENERLTRRAALRKFGFGAGMAALTALSLDDLAWMAFADITISLSQDIVGDFSKAIDAVSTQGKITIIAEAFPCISSLPLDKTIPISNLGVPECINRIADLYDYYVTQSRSYPRLFLFRKKYTEIADFPFITLRECFESLNDLERMYLSDLPKGEYIDGPKFYSILSPEQKELASRGLLSYTSLTEQEQGIVFKKLLIDCTRIYTHIKEISRDRTLMKAPNDLILDYFSDKHKFIYLKSIKDKKALRELYYERDWDKRNWDKKSALGSEPRKIRDVLEILNKRGKMLYFADADYGTKPISVAGLEFSSGEQIMSGIAQVYGMRANLRSDNTVMIMRPKRLVVTTINQINESLQSCMPEPVVRSANFQRRRETLALFYHIVDPLLGSSTSDKKKDVPLSMLDEQALAALAFIILSEFTEMIPKSKNLDVDFDKLKEIYIQMSQEKTSFADVKVTSMSYLTRDDSGQIRSTKQANTTISKTK